MSYLKIAREKEKHTQTEAALRLGVSRSHLSRLEQGKALATAAQAIAIRELYGVPVLEVDHQYKASKLRRDCGIRPYVMDRVNPDPWRTAYEYWGKALRALDLRIFEWMSHYLPSESTHEAYSLLQAAAKGAEPFLGNPHEWDFDLHPVVDRTGRLLGARVLPGLIYRGGDGRDFILFPQVTLRVDVSNAFRLDCLTFYRKENRNHWLDLEFDASGHDVSKDKYRSDKLGMKVVRISGKEIREGRVVELLLQRADAAIQQQVEVPRSAPVKLVRVASGAGWRPGAPRRTG